MIVRLGRRLVLSIPTFLLATGILYAAIRWLPGSPWSSDETLSQARIDEWNSAHHLDQGILRGYASWLRDVTRGEMGVSYSVAAGEKVSSLITGAVPTSLVLGTIALTLAVGVAIGSSFLSVLRPRGVGARTWSGLLYLLNAAPAFWIALTLQDVFALRLHLLPSFGAGPTDEIYAAGPGHFLLERAPYWVLPPLCLALGSVAFLFRFTRANLLDGASRPYVKAGRARGVPPTTLIARHAFAEARLHLVTWVGLAAPSLIGGSIIIESIFGLPGLGRLFAAAIDKRDYPLIMGVGLVMVVASIVASAASDLLYQVVEPRLRNPERAP